MQLSQTPPSTSRSKLSALYVITEKPEYRKEMLKNLDRHKQSNQNQTKQKQIPYIAPAGSYKNTLSIEVGLPASLLLFIPLTPAPLFPFLLFVGDLLLLLLTLLVAVLVLHGLHHAAHLDLLHLLVRLAVLIELHHGVSALDVEHGAGLAHVWPSQQQHLVVHLHHRPLVELESTQRLVLKENGGASDGVVPVR